MNIFTVSETINFYMPVQVVSGRDCLKNKCGLFSDIGGKALIVTGKSSSKNGALQDVIFALNKNGQEYIIFDEIMPNPTVEIVQKASKIGRYNNVDFIIGVGGGSPLDAAKAIAAIIKQPCTDEEVFNKKWTNDILPIIAVPTTAGTGSEVTPYSVLTNPFKKTKMSISSKYMFPKITFLDGKYMLNLSYKTTVHTAIDALSHAIEGMFTTKSNSLGDALGLSSIKILFEIFPFIKNNSLELKHRDSLLYASMLAGIEIAQSGTSVVHAMGYPLTYFYHTDHGEANGVLLGEMLRICEERLPDKTKQILDYAGVDNIEEFSNYIDDLLLDKILYDWDDLEKYAEIVSHNPKLKNTIYYKDINDILRIYKNSNIKK